ncbi:MAG TPA: tetraacyldisaccharide 4'-kinase [Rhizomicrobium sp.]|jgi:tetraacyldisaccharide 4'-kinase|nr:tetraacyldisaccharide 4'-kinase [Rhizomicrobium sp.]
MRAPEFWSRTDFSARTLATTLSPLGLLYGASVAWKHRFQFPYRSHAFVICVGNLTVGGTGKTPLAIALTRMLRSEHIDVAMLTRGYGRNRGNALLVDPQKHGVETVGDEALLLAKVATTIVARNRADGARLAEAQGAHVIVMDDGYQNFTLEKDLSLVVVDGGTGFGNGRIIPAGPLRESLRQGLGRADGVILMGEGTPALPGFSGPVLRARLVSGPRMDGKPLTAFAGIGRPEKFFAMLRALGAELVQTFSFADHHAYSAAEIATLKTRARETNTILITTEKDIVRLGASDREEIEVLTVHAVFDDPASPMRLVQSLLAQANAR